MHRSGVNDHHYHRSYDFFLHQDDSNDSAVHFPSAEEATDTTCLISITRHDEYHYIGAAFESPAREGVVNGVET